MTFKKFINNIQKYLPTIFKDKKTKLLAEINSKYFHSTHLPVYYRDDEDIVSAITKKNGMLLMYTSDRLRDNKDIVLGAIKNDIYALEYASDRLKNDKDLLEILEKEDISMVSMLGKKWYQEKMEVLANIRDKELMDNSIVNSNIKSKKIKF